MIRFAAASHVGKWAGALKNGETVLILIDIEFLVNMTMLSVSVLAMVKSNTCRASKVWPGQTDGHGVEQQIADAGQTEDV